MTARQRLVIRCLMMSIDGYACGENQRLDQPFGDNTEGFTDWIFATRSFHENLGTGGGEVNADHTYVAPGMDKVETSVVAVTMKTTSLCPWPYAGLVGWWGPNPPYHSPTFVLTHHARDPIPMEGGTTFHFATGSIEDTLARAFAAADGKDVRLMGGATTVRQYLAAGLVDEMHLVVVPMLLGRGERVFPDASPPPGYVCTERVATDACVHLRFTRR